MKTNHLFKNVYVSSADIVGVDAESDRQHNKACIATEALTVL